MIFSEPFIASEVLVVLTHMIKKRKKHCQFNQQHNYTQARVFHHLWWSGQGDGASQRCTANLPFAVVSTWPQTEPISGARAAHA